MSAVSNDAVVKVSGTDEVLTYDNNTQHIDLKGVPLTYANAQKIAAVYQQLETIQEGNTLYQWSVLKARLNPSQTPKNLEYYWTSVKSSASK